MKNDLAQLGKVQGTPVIEGDQVTFIWYGKRAPILMGDFNDWDEDHPVIMERIGRQVWAAQFTLPRDAYIEYHYRFDDQAVLDPYNPQRVPNGLGEANNYFYMSEADPTPLIRLEPEIQRGKVMRFSLETEDYAVGKRRSVYLYQPTSDEPAPLLVVWDGLDYLRRSHLVTMVDNLIAQNQIQPIAMALVKNGGRGRLVEYACSEATLAFLEQKVLPLAAERLNVLDLAENPGSYGILGASMGGLMALFSALRLPTIFGHVISQSGAFDFLGRDSLVFDLIEQGPALPIQVWMDVGTMESLLGANRHMREVLLSRGYRLDYVEYNGGHNYTAWQNDVWHGLVAQFGNSA